ncbi:MAG: ATP-binding protein [Actinobacteria bacterium]|nr:ATP-binding protein [Actinomycetota bacterium]
MNNAAHTLIIDTPPDTLDSVHELLRIIWEKSPDVSAEDQIRFETALIELASNIFRHADDGGGISCLLSVEISADKIEANLRDTGQPGDIQLTGVEMPDAYSESGRGIALINALVDEFIYAREGEQNVWRILRKRTQ